VALIRKSTGSVVVNQFLSWNLCYVFSLPRSCNSHVVCNENQN